MKTLKKTLCLVLAVVMAVGMLVIPAYATDFTDDAKITHDEAVAVLSGLGIVNGVGDGSFNPDGTFTRAQAAALLANVLLTPDYAAILDSSKAVFSDVPVTSGYNKYITWAVEQGHIHGYPDGTFKPSKELTGTELAALMLEALGEEIDASNYKNFVNLTAKDKGLIDGIKNYVPSNPISRDDAVQMMFNTMNKSTSSTSEWVVLENGRADWNPGYKSDTEANALLVAATLNATAAAGTQYTVKKNTTPVGSILTKTYKAVHVSSDYDYYHRPANSWYDKDGDVLFSEPQAPVLEYTTPVKVKTIYSDLGLTYTTTATQFTDGTQRNASTGMDLTAAATSSDLIDLRANNEATVHFSDYGVLTQVYEDGKDTYGRMHYRVTQAFAYYANVTGVKDEKSATTNVTKLTASFNIFAPYHQGTDYLGVAHKSTTFVDFSKDDRVVLGRAYDTDNGRWVFTDAYKAAVVDGTLTRINRKGTVSSYVIDGKEYYKSVSYYSNPDNLVGGIDLLDASVGKAVSVYVDQYGYILETIKGAASDPNYILVLNTQAPSGNGWMQSGGVSTGLVYGILSDGTYGTFTVNYSSYNGTSYLHTQAAINEIYSYSVNADGELLLAANSATCGDMTTNITNGSTSTTFNNNAVAPASSLAVLNSETLFVYYTAANGVVQTFATRVGNAYCGNIINDTTHKAYEGLKNSGAAKVVFVNQDYNAVINTSGYVYIKDTTVNSTTELVNGVASTVFHYTGIKSDGTTVDLWTTNGSLVAARGLYQVNTDNSIDSALTAGQVLNTDYTVVHGKVIRRYVDTLGVDETDPYDTEYNYRAYTDGIYTFCGDSTSVQGNEYWAIVKGFVSDNGAFTAIWFIS